MEWFTWIVATLLCGIPLVLGFKEWMRWRKILTALDRLPGPPALPIIGNTLQFLKEREDLIPISKELCTDYGPICRIWNVVFAVCLISKAEYVETILSSSKELQKSVCYKFLEPWLGTGLLTSTGTKWFTHRKLLTPSFHFSILETFLSTFNDKSQILLKKLGTVPSGTECNIYSHITLCSLDIICEAVMGIDMNTQVDNHENYQNFEYISGIYTLVETTVNRIFRPWLHPKWIFYHLSTEGKKFLKSVKILHDFTDKVVKDKRNKRKKLTNGQKGKDNDDDLGMKPKQAFLDLLLETSEKEQMLTNEEVREEVDTFMFEGHDTTTSALCWSVFLLGHHPDIQDKVVEELNFIFQGEDRNITSTDLKEMKYLERVIKETLRLYPSVPFFDRTLKEDMKLGEYLVPAGVDLRIAVFNMHRSSEYFENPETFNPDNFLPENVRNRHPFAYIPFSAGPRNCIGQKFAMMELKIVLAKIFLNFRVESIEKIEDIILMIDLILKSKSGLKVKLYPRSKTV